MSKSNSKSQTPGWSTTTLDAITQDDVLQNGPTSKSEFVYVDISSIDNRAKRIVEPKVLSVANAPSRAKQNLKAGDVLISMTRPNLNAVALVSSELEGAVGSTGFHVLRSAGAETRWLFYVVQAGDFVDAMCRMVQGALYPAVRPKDVRSFSLRIPPLMEQQRIVDTLDELFSDLDAGVAALARVRTKLRHYRAAVLKTAVEGALTAEWRKQHPATEPASALLTRILAERRRRWEQDQLRKFAAAGKEPPQNWKAKYEEPAILDTTDFPTLPEGWCWATLDMLVSQSPQNGAYYHKQLYGSGTPNHWCGNLRGTFHTVSNRDKMRNQSRIARIPLAQGRLPPCPSSHPRRRPLARKHRPRAQTTRGWSRPSNPLTLKWSAAPPPS